ncbi:hypothetical protein CLU79DRAFT_836824 [Phycomyces nitens]|nr:hypothetical protein CLU79DRAFT_836824 [Phycomyces nitens]
MKDSTCQSSYYQHSSPCTQPTSYILPSPNTLASILNPQKQQKHTQTYPQPSFYDLQEVVSKYQSQPELLKLILNGKLEEDKRRTEEAKLRAKELDLYLQKCRHEFRSKAVDSPLLDRSDSTSRTSISGGTNYGSPPTTQELYTPTGPIRRRKSSPGTDPSNNRTTPYPLQYSRQPTYWSAFRAPHVEIAQEERRDSAAEAMVAMGSLFIVNSKADSFASPYSPTTSPRSQSAFSPFHSQPPTQYDTDISQMNILTKDGFLQMNMEQCSRRKREMQAVTKIVKTRDFPYNDNFFWKNNGNTTHKKNGCRSIYYKCSNSSKGCSVNKTVAEKEGGYYVIKYRGEHQKECSNVEHIRDL